MKYPKFFRKIEIIYHPIIELSPIPDEENLRDYAAKLTDLLEKVIATETEPAQLDTTKTSI
jgi:hypothetical protein